MHYRYNTVAITLHWVIALCLLTNLGLGWWMGDALNNQATQSLATDAFQWHKSLGLLILLLSLLRLFWRILHPPPPLPENSPRWEHTAARLTHMAFYVLMIAIPLSGWLYVSAQWRGDTALNVPTVWFGLFEVPHLFALNTLAPDSRRWLATWLLSGHESLSGAFALLLVLHIAAALRHHLQLKDEVLLRMLPANPLEPFTAEPRPRRAALLLFIAALALGIALIGTDSVAPSRPNNSESRIVQALTDLRDTQVSAVHSPSWKLIDAESYIRFSGTHAGQRFAGNFTRWLTDIRFDPDSAQTAIAVVIDTASATDGVPMHDRTLPQTEWFNVAAYPFATYAANAAVAREDGSYALHGTLTIKQHAIAMAPLTLTLKEENNQLRIYGELVIDRAKVDMGMESDPEGEWVSREIAIQVNALAER